MESNQAEIDEIAFRLYGIVGEDRRAIEEGSGMVGSVQKAEGSSDGDADDSDDERDENLPTASRLLQPLVSYLLGTSYGRWDIRYATGEKPAPELPDPFAPLPACPPGMLQNAEGLPARNDVLIVPVGSRQWAAGSEPASSEPASSEQQAAGSEQQAAGSEGSEDSESLPTADCRLIRQLPTADCRLPTYPLRISWPGILVDDEGHHEDIVSRVRAAIAVVWGERAEAIEQEACGILGVKALREYFRRPASFFDDHLKRYSKSRRQAPIYWPLATANGSYTLWLYYHRLNDQTLYSCVNDFVDPKLAACSRQTAELRKKAARSRQDEEELSKLTSLELELQDFRAELLRVAAFWKPNLNDGVQISAAPLWKLFGHRAWQKKLKETWQSLEAGEYDWAHLAYSIWPERVREKCQGDKSLAIAHDLENVYVAPPATAKKGRGRAKQAVIEEADE